jgi:hypothetical protein
MPPPAQPGLPACKGSPILDPWYGDSDRLTASGRTNRTAEVHGPKSDRCCPRDVRPGHIFCSKFCSLTVGKASLQGAAG